MPVDFLTFNGDNGFSGQGNFSSVLASEGMDPGLRRQFLHRDTEFGRDYKCVVINSGKTDKKGQPVKVLARVDDLIANGMQVPTFNSTALRKEEWIRLDEQVLRAARYRLRAWADLSAANSYGGFNGMATTILEHETMSDPGEAIVDMDGMTKGRTDQPLFQQEGLPLPMTHSDFYFSSRFLAASRAKGMPVDTTMGEAAGRRVAEMIEKITIGTNTGITYGGTNTASSYSRTSKVYGYTNFPSRLTYTGTAPTTGGWTAATTINNVLAMRQLLYNNKFFGPFMLYHSNDWDTYLDADYILTGGNVATQTLRERLEAIEGIAGVRRLDFMFGSAPTYQNESSRYDNLNPFTMVLVQMTPDVARAINGQDITVVQWESQGGMRLNFKVYAIQVPQLRADFYGNCGICHGTAV